MSERSRDLPKLAHLGGTQALTTTPIVGTPATQRPDAYVPGVGLKPSTSPARRYEAAMSRSWRRTKRIRWITVIHAIAARR